MTASSGHTVAEISANAGSTGVTGWADARDAAKIATESSAIRMSQL